MTKRPLLVSIIAYFSVVVGTLSLTTTIIFAFSKSILSEFNAIQLLGVRLFYDLLFISSGYYILKNRLLGWQLGLFTQLLNVTRSYGALIYIFINISQISFDTHNTADYLIKYAFQALVSMGIVYYYLNIKILRFFGAEGVVKNKTLKVSTLTSILIIGVQILTHTISL